MQEILTPQRVEDLFLDSLYRAGESIETRIEVEGIVNSAWFEPARLESHRTEIEQMLDQLPESFKRSVGGGASFLNACEDKNGDLWTGVHTTVERLLLLGMGIGKVECLAPRELWEILPGGMPYYAVND